MFKDSIFLQHKKKHYGISHNCGACSFHHVYNLSSRFFVRRKANSKYAFAKTAVYWESRHLCGAVSSYRREWRHRRCELVKTASCHDVANRGTRYNLQHVTRRTVYYIKPQLTRDHFRFVTFSFRYVSLRFVSSRKCAMCCCRHYLHAVVTKFVCIFSRRVLYRRLYSLLKSVMHLTGFNRI